MIRIHVIHDYRDGPWGGGNQFLKALREELRRTDRYAEAASDADAILFNSHHRLDEVARLRVEAVRAVFLHRVDGPVRLVRGSDAETDRLVFRANSLMADGTVFQSDWSRNANFQEGFEQGAFQTTILNAPDPRFFHPPREAPDGESSRLRLIASSWSNNVRKGFDVYEWLDRNLDFERFDFTFVGNTPIEFLRIRHVEPLPSVELSDLLRRHDVFITASRSDPCSNALLEAMHCGLPAIAREDGGNPEIVGRGGELFEQPEEIPGILDRLAGSLSTYRERIDLPKIEAVAGLYVEFAERVVAGRERGLVPRASLDEVAAFVGALPRNGAEGLWPGMRRRARSLLRRRRGPRADRCS